MNPKLIELLIKGAATAAGAAVGKFVENAARNLCKQGHKALTGKRFKM